MEIERRTACCATRRDVENMNAAVRPHIEGLQKDPSTATNAKPRIPAGKRASARTSSP
jgi:hypothetical protein